MKASKQVHWGSITVTRDRLSFLDRLFLGASLAGVLIWCFPHISFAQTATAPPLLFEINNLDNSTLPKEDYLAQVLAADIPPKPIDPRAEPLRAYLLSKKSPLSNQAEVLLEQYHYRLILGIAFAESNFCKYQVTPNNCWGIGGSSPETYPTPVHGIIRANELIQKYHDLGMTTPKLMRTTWVGWQNDKWIIAVEQVTEELENLGI